MTGIERHTQRLMGMMVVLGMALPGLAFGAVHSADISGNGRISLSELLRVIQFYNSETYSCAAESEDGYTPEAGACDCSPHASDYIHQDWRIELSELLRLIQLYNMKRYTTAPGGIEGSEDGFMPVSDEELDPHIIPVAGDTDGNYLTEAEELALGIEADAGDPPIGIRLALAVWEGINQLEDMYYPEGETEGYRDADCTPPVEGFPLDSVYFCKEAPMECGCYDPFTDGLLGFQPFYIIDPTTDIVISYNYIIANFLRNGSLTYLGGECDWAEGSDYCNFDTPPRRLDVVALVQMLSIDPNAI